MSVLFDPIYPFPDGYLTRSQSVYPGSVNLKHPGAIAPPETRTVNAPSIKASSQTPHKKSNACIPYTRITKKNQQLLAGVPMQPVFVSKTYCEYDGSGLTRRSVIMSLEEVNKEIREKAVLQGNRDPLDGWRSVAALREWTLDGVLLGLHGEVVKEDTLNVCIQGHCVASNIYDTEKIFPFDRCFLCLIATLHDEATPTEHFKFEYVPCTDRSFVDLSIHRTYLSRQGPSISSQKLSMIVGAWAVGRVTDSAVVLTKNEHNISLCVSVEWIGWRAMREAYNGCGIGDKWLSRPGAPPPNTCAMFNWPSKTGTPLETPGVPKRSAAQIMLDKHVSKDEAKRCTPAPYSGSKRARELTLLNDDAPPSPLKEGLLDAAENDANETFEALDALKSTWLQEMQNISPEDASSEAWASEFTRRIAVYRVRHAHVLQKLEQSSSRSSTMDKMMLAIAAHFDLTKKKESSSAYGRMLM